jgi:hypothetical protein
MLLKEFRSVSLACLVIVVLKVYTTNLSDGSNYVKVVICTLNETVNRVVTFSKKRTVWK